MAVKYDPQTHQRRSVRLAGFDYSQAGAHFITICTQDRKLSLQAEPVRDAIRSAWSGLPARFPGVALDEFVIMPNHVHGIIILEGEAASSASMVLGAASSAPTLGRIVRAFTSISGVEANRALGRSNRPFWQRSYHEHIIRNEGELHAVRRYILGNPGNWPDDPENPSNL